MVVQALHCPSCSHLIFSRARNDLRSCPCGAISVDGGFDYMKASWQPDMAQPVMVSRSIPQDRKELEFDYLQDPKKWRYGIIKVRSKPKIKNRKRMKR